ncbi:MAG: hypothetical protein WB973_14820 [Thermoanaerobaculia bacterium]
MSTQQSVNEKSAAAAAQDPAVTPESIVAQLRTVRQQIPDFGSLSSADSRPLQSAAHVHPDFTQAAISAMGASATVLSAVGTNAEDLQREIDTAGRWAVVEDELRAMLRGVMAANLTRRHRIGKTALLTYAVSQKLVRSPDHADLLPHVDVMNRMNRFGRRKKRTVPAPPAPVPATLVPQI